MFDSVPVGAGIGVLGTGRALLVDDVDPLVRVITIRAWAETVPGRFAPVSTDGPMTRRDSGEMEVINKTLLLLGAPTPQP